LSSDAEDTKPIDKDASETLQILRAVVLELVERPASKPLPSVEAKFSAEELVLFDRLVGKYAALLPVLELPSNAAYCATALLGALALKAGRIKVADHIYEELNFGTSNVTALAYVMQGVLGFAFAIVILAVLSCLLLIVADVTIFHEADLSFLFTKDLLTSEFAKVAIASFFGLCGGVVSLLLRLSEFEILKDKSRTFLRASGATQPLIGGIFAFVLGGLISARIINISVGGSSDLSSWLFVVVGFLAGFSERFTRNLLNVAEGHLGGTTGASPPETMRAIQLTDFGTDQSPIMTDHSIKIRSMWNSATKVKITPATIQYVFRSISDDRKCAPPLSACGISGTVRPFNSFTAVLPPRLGFVRRAAPHRQIEASSCLAFATSSLPLVSLIFSFALPRQHQAKAPLGSSRIASL
jgi:hypothetical protein